MPLDAAGRRWMSLITDRPDVPSLHDAASRVEKEFGGINIIFECPSK